MMIAAATPPRRLMAAALVAMLALAARPATAVIIQTLSGNDNTSAQCLRRSTVSPLWPSVSAVAQCLRHWESGPAPPDRPSIPVGLPALSVSETPTYT